MTGNPTGAQFAISAGPWQAIVTEVGATLRSLSYEGTELLWTFAADQPPRSSQGRQLVPWPNRIRDGKYLFEGETLQLPITEVARGCASHGLNSGRAWQLESHDDASVVLSTTFYPQPGWPGVLTVQITHLVTAQGLRVEVVAANQGNNTLPYGYGAHPYFAFGDLANVTLRLPFDKELLVEPDRLLPVELVPITPIHDFRNTRELEATEFDTAFTNPASPNWSVELTSAERTIEVWGEAGLDWVQVFTRGERDAIAIEPMTCGPDAFNPGPTHEGRIVLEPGESTAVVWGVAAH